MNEIKILGKPYRIDRIDEYDNELDIGTYDPRGAVIEVLSSLEKHIEEEIILHEVIHLIDEELALDLTEEQVKRLSIALYAVYRENQMHIITHPGGGA